MLELRRRDGAPLRVGHRGAAALAPENTLAAFRAALAHGVDVIEFDVLDLPRGPLVVAHSAELAEVSHGAAAGDLRACSLEEARAVAPALPTLDEALAWFQDEGDRLGVHIDLKLGHRLDEVAAAITRHGLEARTVVSSCHVASLRAVAAGCPGVRIGLTYPDDRFGVGRRPYLRPAVRAGLAGMRASVPLRVARWLERAGASALMLQHTLVTRAAVARAHAAGAAVLAWTVDDEVELARLDAAGVDGVITNDPRIFAR